MIQFFLLALTLTVVSCQYGAYRDEGQEQFVEPHYQYEYSVNDPKTGDIKGQKEERKGEETKGEYYLVEPDGSMRIVQYHVDGKSGFIADVQRQPPAKKESRDSAYYRY